MTDKEIHQKIKSINEKFDTIQTSVNFYRKRFSDLEDQTEYYSKHSWLPDARKNIKNAIFQMKEILIRTEIEQKHFDKLEKQLDEIDNIL